MKVVLGVSGGIAAYKAPELVRRLREAGAEVRVILTPNATRFVSPLSLAAVSGHGVIVEQWGDSDHGGVDHIELARWSDVLLIAPATANVLAKLAAGIADDALTTYALAHRGITIVAPAMNTFMLGHPTVAANLDTLRARGVRIVEPVDGLLACGEEGAGRMPDPPVLVRAVLEATRTRDMAGMRVLVTAGPTREPIDPVRYLSNRSSGKMGYALAEAAARRGAVVTLVSGPVQLSVPDGVWVERVITAQQMYDAVMRHVTQQDVIIKAAAVADFSPQDVATTKIKKVEGSATLTLTLNKTPDILAAVGALDPRPFVVAFAAETNAVEANAALKLEKKNADLIVANDVSNRSIGFDSNENEAVVIGRDGSRTVLERASKSVIAHGILDLVVAAIRLS